MRIAIVTALLVFGLAFSASAQDLTFEWDKNPDTPAGLVTAYCLHLTTERGNFSDARKECGAADVLAKSEGVFSMTIEVEQPMPPTWVSVTASNVVGLSSGYSADLLVGAPPAPINLRVVVTVTVDVR